MFSEILQKTAPLLAGTALEHLSGADWDAFGIVDAVSSVQAGSEEYALLQQVQRVEFEVLLERFCGAGNT